jgi:hypothetical protein
VSQSAPLAVHATTSAEKHTDLAFDATVLNFGSGPLGIRVEENPAFNPTDTMSGSLSSAFAVQLAGFNRLPDGSEAAAEASGRVRIGDRIAAVGGVSTAREAYDEVISRVQSSPRPLTLSFCHRPLALNLDPDLRAPSAFTPAGSSIMEPAGRTLSQNSVVASPSSVSYASGSPNSVSYPPGSPTSQASADTMDSYDTSPRRAWEAAQALSQQLGPTKKVVFGQNEELGLVLGSADALDQYVSSRLLYLYLFLVLLPRSR